MSGSIRTITDKNEFHDIFYKSFANGSVFLKTANGNLKILFMGYSDGEAAFKIPYVKSMPPSCLIFVRVENVTIYAELGLISKEEDEVYTFRPVKMQSITVDRSGERKSVAAQNEKSIVYISNLITDFIIEKSIALDFRKADRVKHTIISEMDTMFPQKKVYFMNEGMSDPRMRYFYDMGKPYLITDINDPKQKDNADYRAYIENIYSKDYFLINRKNLISEVAFPILYKQFLPFGYIQVNSTVAANESYYNIVRKLSLITSEIFARNNLFQIMNDRIIVSDVSKGGFSVVFKDRTYLRYFKEKSYLHCTMKITGSDVSMLAVVRNIVLLENKIMKVGCEILKMDQNSSEIYEKFCCS